LLTSFNIISEYSRPYCKVRRATGH
jgi:hypothetical protein